MMAPHALAGLLQLSSSTLPIGAFSHSLGLEAAHAAGIVRDVVSAERWIGDMLEAVWASGEAALWLALHEAWTEPDADAVRAHTDWLLATRETSELRLENEQTGRSLTHWLLALPDASAQHPDQCALLVELQPVAFASVHALAARVLGLDARTGLHALAWSLVENLVLAALKLVPLGQTAAQGLLRRLALRIPAAIECAMSVPVARACNFAPMLAILSSQHETQYSRLFRS